MKKLILLVLAIILASSPIFGENNDFMVYGTGTGSKYHLDGCRYLNKSKIPMTLETAVSRGLSPCSVCKPPKMDAHGNEMYRVNVANITSCKEADIFKMMRAKVTRTVDGDTIKVTIENAPSGIAKDETIRMLGVDTPETVHPSKPVERFGKEASEYTKRMLTGKTVYLALDWDLRDNYGRLLSYIYTEDGDCFNARIITEGYGFAYLSFPFQFIDEFTELESNARSSNKGLWNQT